MVAEFLDDLEVIVWESSFEDLVDVGFGIDLVVVRAHLGVETLFDDVAGELQLAQSDEVFGNLLEDLLVLLPVFQLDDVLDQVVSVWILDELTDVFDDVVGEFELLRSGTLLKASLHHATSVFVLSDWDTVVDAGLEDEVSVLTCLEAAQVVIILRSL